MPGETIQQGGKPYLRIVQGNWVQKVAEGTPGSRSREYVVAATNKSGVAHEIPYMNWTGIVQSITFKENEFGRVCNIELEDAILTFSTDNQYFSTMAQSLPNVDFSKPVVFHPYSMEIDDGKKRSGCKLSQGGKKVPNFYYDTVTGKNIEEYPAVNEKQKDKKGYWKMFFGEVEEYLVDKTKALVIAPATVTKTIDVANLEDELGEPESDLPF